jgi:hypothetical protein
MNDMNGEHEIEMQLWDYIDGSVDAGEKIRIEQLLKDNWRWQQQYKELLEMHQLMKDEIALEEPSMRFTKNVMEEIAKTKIAPPTKSYINRKIITSIAAFFIVLIGILLVYLFALINWAEQSNTASSFDFTKFDISRYLSQPVLNVFWICNVVLALVLLDRYLSRKRKREQHIHS